eukprot:2227867-Pyramimonas_sp.AAC.1
MLFVAHSARKGGLHAAGNKAGAPSGEFWICLGRGRTQLKKMAVRSHGEAGNRKDGTGPGE